MAKAGYSGFFTKGLASGITSGANLGMQLTQLRWQKKKQKELDEMNAKMNDSWNTIGQEMISLANDGQLSEDDQLKIYTLTMAAPYEMQGVMQNLRTSLSQFKTKDFEKQMEYVKAFYEYAQGLDPKNIDSLYEEFRGYITDPHALTLFEVADKKLRHEVTKPTTEVFPSLEAGRAKYPTAEIKYSADAGGYVVGAGKVKPTTPTTPPALSAKDNWAIENYKAGKINFDELSKYMGTYIAPEEMSAKEKEIELMKEYGATNEEIKNKLLGKGVEGEPTPPTAPAIENVREDIKNADTLEDARRIHQNQIKKYGEEGLGIDDIDKFWAESQIPYLDNIKTSIGNLVDEKGWLKKGAITSAEVGLDFEGEQPVEEIYKKLYEEYMKYFDTLTKMGLPLLEFPILKPLEEIEKVGFGEGFWGIGKQKGQYKSIYK